MADNWFCSEVSREAGESITATASRVDVWLCLEYTGMWGRKALQESDLPEAVKTHLQSAESSIPRARVELIRQENRQPDGDIRFLVALSDEANSALYQFSLKAYEDILALDLAKIVARDTVYDKHLSRESLVLVCVNGKRDQCCAKYGLPVYHALARQKGANVWQCTHLGGHRFAANVVALPTGATYGRVTPAEAASLAETDQISLAHYRGLCSYDKPAQAADTFLRAHLGQTAVDALTLNSLEKISDTEWVARFDSGGRKYQTRVARQPAGIAAYESCGDEARKEQMIYVLLDITEIEG